MNWKTNKINILGLFFTLFSVVAFAQEIRLKGTVQFDNTLLKDINVLNKSTQYGTATNEEGEFEINVALGDSILFSSLSFQNRIIKVSASHMENKTMEVFLDLLHTFLSHLQLTS